MTRLELLSGGAPVGAPRPVGDAATFTHGRCLGNF